MADELGFSAGAEPLAEVASGGAGSTVPLPVDPDELPEDTPPPLDTTPPDTTQPPGDTDPPSGGFTALGGAGSVEGPEPGDEDTEPSEETAVSGHET
jgi:hypothetical protein